MNSRANPAIRSLHVNENSTLEFNSMEEVTSSAAKFGFEIGDTVMVKGLLGIDYITLKSTNEGGFGVEQPGIGWWVRGEIQGYALNKFGRIENTIEELVNNGRKYKVGDVVELLGYYSAGDGAGHKRKIEQTDDGSGVQLANGLWANVVHNGEVNVSWFGFDSNNQNNDNLLELVCNKYKKLYIDSDITINRTIELKKEGMLITGYGDSRYDKQITSTHSEPTFRFNPSIADNNNNQPKCPEFYHLTVRCCQFYEVFERALPIVDGRDYPYFLRPKVQKCFFIFNGDSKTKRDSSALYFSKAFDFSVRECNFRGFPNGAGVFRGCDISEFALNRVEGFKREAITSIRESTFGSDLKIEHCDLMISDCFEDEVNTRFVINSTSLGDKILDNYFEYMGKVSGSRLAFIRIGGNYPNIVNNRMEGSTTQGVSRIKYPVLINGGVHSIYIDRIYNAISDLGIVKLEGISLGIDNLRNKNITIKNIESREYIMMNNVGNKLILDYSNFSNFTNEGDHSYRLIIADDGAIIGSSGKNLHVSLLRATPILKTSGKFKLRFVYKSETQTFVRVDNKNYNAGILTSFYIPKSNEYTIFESEITTNAESYPYLVILTNDSTRILSIEIEKVYAPTVLDIKLLNTPYHTLKMQQEGVYEDFITYMDSKTEYDAQQREAQAQQQAAFEQREDQNQTYEEWLSSYPMLLPAGEEPQPSEALVAFKTKYLG